MKERSRFLILWALVRNVCDFMTVEKKVLGDEGITKYNQRLADIYRAEEEISGSPINMDKFHLFTSTEKSSIPLNLAYKAAQVLDTNLAKQYLYLLRYKMIVAGCQTTKKSGLLLVAEEIGFDVAQFERILNSAVAKENLAKD